TARPLASAALGIDHSAGSAVVRPCGPDAGGSATTRRLAQSAARERCRRATYPREAARWSTDIHAASGWLTTVLRVHREGKDSRRSGRNLRGCCHYEWRPQRDSNPCFGLERATSWASGRWGRTGWNSKLYHTPIRQVLSRRLVTCFTDDVRCNLRTGRERERGPAVSDDRAVADERDYGRRSRALGPCDGRRLRAHDRRRGSPDARSVPEGSSSAAAGSFRRDCRSRPHVTGTIRCRHRAISR